MNCLLEGVVTVDGSSWREVVRLPIREVRVRAHDLVSYAAELKLHPVDGPVPVGVLGTGGESLSVWNSEREFDASAMNQFLTDAEGLADIASYTVPPRDPADGLRWIDSLIGFGDVPVFVSVQPGHLVDWLSGPGDRSWLGVTLSTIGIALAEEIVECSSLDLPYRIDTSMGSALESVRTVAAAMFAFSSDLPPSLLLDVLNETNLEAFQLDSEKLTWRDIIMPVNEIPGAQELFWSVTASPETLGRWINELGQ